MQVEDIRPDNLVEIMLSSPLHWTLVTGLISKVMIAKETEKRERQRAPEGRPPTLVSGRGR